MVKSEVKVQANKQVPKVLLKRILLIALMCLIGYIIAYHGFGKYFNLDYFLAKKQFFFSHLMLSLFILLALYLVLSFFYLPIAFLSIFSGFIFGFARGSVIVYAGAMLNMYFSFLWARYLFKDFFEALKGKKQSYSKIADFVSERGKQFVLYARLFFVTPYNILNIICGISDMQLKDYLSASALGAIPQALFYSYVGSKFATMATTGNIRGQALLLSLTVVAIILMAKLGAALVLRK